MRGFSCHFAGNDDEVSHFERPVVLNSRYVFLPHPTAQPHEGDFQPPTSLRDAPVNGGAVEDDKIRTVTTETLMEKASEGTVPHRDTPRRCGGTRVIHHWIA